METILITGATGFIGSNLIVNLRNLGYKVYGISLRGGNIQSIKIDMVDCSDIQKLNHYCADKSIDGIIHTAALIPESWWSTEAKQSMYKNIRMTMNMLEICRKQKSKQLVYMSGSCVYGFPRVLPVTEVMLPEPSGFYPLGKYVGELLCQQFQRKYDLRIAILRISAPYGRGNTRETVVRKFIRQALASEDITLYGTGSRSQDFVYIQDIINAIVRSYEDRAKGVFNISSGIATSMTALAETVLRVIPNVRSKIVYTDMPDPQEDYRAAFSFETATKCFGYKPKFSLAKGIREYAQAITEELYS